ncbi:hypothetical protein [Nocardia jinanensis]|uniref:hypothetical protein n=1 Tax=Nocardia jinanensis TaxID=382504 RepID=UPI000ABC070D|nr:hypothetical protein [Nocardia jinanensis]
MVSQLSRLTECAPIDQDIGGDQVCEDGDRVPVRTRPCIRHEMRDHDHLGVVLQEMLDPR